MVKRGDMKVVTGRFGEGRQTKMECSSTDMPVFEPGEDTRRANDNNSTKASEASKIWRFKEQGWFYGTELGEYVGMGTSNSTHPVG
jgi:hypothetical protein